MLACGICMDSEQFFALKATVVLQQAASQNGVDVATPHGTDT